MIKIDNVEITGVKAAIRGMRNPLNSWEKSDSIIENGAVVIGENDRQLIDKLIKAGSDHRKFLRMIHVSMDITAPLYWWKEYDTYKVGTVTNSCSTMHKIHEKEFTIDDFSHEHLNDLSMYILRESISIMNIQRESYIKTKDKSRWWQMIQLLPSSYNQKRTVDFNFETILNIVNARKNHKLDEWRELCIKLNDIFVATLYRNGGDV